MNDVIDVVGLGPSSPRRGDAEHDPEDPESTAEIPTSAMVGPAASLISSQTGWLVVYDRPRFSVAVCFR